MKLFNYYRSLPILMTALGAATSAAQAAPIGRKAGSTPSTPTANSLSGTLLSRNGQMPTPLLSISLVKLNSSSIAQALTADASSVAQRATEIRNRRMARAALPTQLQPRTVSASSKIVASAHATNSLRLSSDETTFKNPLRSRRGGMAARKSFAFKSVSDVRRSALRQISMQAPSVQPPSVSFESHNPASASTVAMAPTIPSASPATTNAPLVANPPLLAMAPPSPLNPRRAELAPRNDAAAGNREGRILSSRSMNDRILLARMESDLIRGRHRLNNASEDLTHIDHDLTRFTDTLRQAMFEAGPNSRGLHPFVKVAQRYAGTPYVWGGESARGFDCSGFIIRVMRDLGYRALPHSAAEQFTYGKPIATPLLEPGDLVFFANTYKPGISHVGIYLGRGRFIHAAGTGKGTIVSYLSASPYHQKYAGARRLIPGG